MALTTHTSAMGVGYNDQAMLLKEAILNEMKLEAIEHILKYYEDIKKYYNKQIKKRLFRLCDWVLKKVVRLQEQGKFEKAHISSLKSPFKGGG